METIKENITQVAVRLFNQLGIRNVSIDDICAELRISKKTFYQFFKKKEDLVEHVIINIHQQHIENAEKCLKDKNAIEVFILMIREVKKSVDNAPFIFWHDLQKYYPALFKKYDQLKTETMKAVFEQNIRQGIEEGYYRENLDVELLSFFHSVQIKNTFEIMIQAQKKYTLKRLTDFFIDLMIHLIVNEKGLKYVQENLIEKK